MSLLLLSCSACGTGPQEKPLAVKSCTAQQSFLQCCLTDPPLFTDKCSKTWEKDTLRCDNVRLCASWGERWIHRESVWKSCHFAKSSMMNWHSHSVSSCHIATQAHMTMQLLIDEAIVRTHLRASDAGSLSKFLRESKDTVSSET